MHQDWREDCWLWKVEDFPHSRSSLLIMFILYAKNGALWPSYLTVIKDIIHYYTYCMMFLYV